MKKLFTLLFFAIFLINTLSAQAYQSAESSEYDPINKRWLTSNSSSIIADDGMGNLSFFGNGTAFASHGMEVMGEVLFVVNGNTIQGYDLNTEEQVASLGLSGSLFLNGLTNDGVSNLYVTDFAGEKIYKIDVSDITTLDSEIIVNNTQGTPNGIVYDGENNRLLYGTWGDNAAIKAVDLSDNSVSTIITTNLSSIDGIDEDNDGNYYISTWSPDQISKFDKDFANPLEIITTPFISNPADIGYALQNDTLAIPIGNDVVFVGFEPSTTSVSSNLLDFDFKVFPNPVTEASYIEFALKENAVTDLQILDQQGNLVRSLLQGNQSAGKHKVLFAGHDLVAGIYYCHLKIAENSITRKLIVL